jgi:hypothetical protein
VTKPQTVQASVVKKYAFESALRGFVDIAFDPALDAAKVGSSVPSGDHPWKF